MPPPSELQLPHPGILFFGPAGAGKTSFVMTAGADLVLLSLDRGGWGSGLSLRDKFRDARMKVDVRDCFEDPGRPGSGLEKLKKELFSIQDQFVRKTFKQKIVAIDSLTTLGDQAMRSVLTNSGVMTQGVVQTKVKSTGIEIQHWGIAMVEVENCINLLRSFPCVGVLIAHDTTEVVDDINKKIVSVIGAKLASKVPTFFDEVWYAATRPIPGNQIEYLIQTVPSSSIMARSRYSLPNATKQDDGFPEVLKKMGYDLSKIIPIGGPSANV